MVKVTNLTKYYKKTKAVDNLSIIFDSGKVSVLAGQNGAGKTTTINCIANIIRYNGEISICGESNKKISAIGKLGIIPETANPYDYLTVWEHMEFVAKAYKISNWIDKSNELLEQFDMNDNVNKLGKELSKGMKQKLSVCTTLLHNPEVLILDEPFNGLDPLAIRRLKDIIVEKARNGSTVIVSTHIFDVVESVWDKAYIIKKGKLCVEETKEMTNKTLEELYFNANGCDYIFDKEAN